jgi:hypothetical protein
MAMGDDISQLKLCAILEKWIVALDKYMTTMKKVDVEAFDMRVPDDELIPMEG